MFPAVFFVAVQNPTIRRVDDVDVFLDIKIVHLQEFFGTRKFLIDVSTPPYHTPNRRAFSYDPSQGPMISLVPMRSPRVASCHGRDEKIPEIQKT